MRTIHVRLSNKNSTTNKKLLEFIESSLSRVIGLNCKYEFEFVKSSGGTYPQATFAGNKYVGVQEITDVVNNLNPKKNKLDAFDIGDKLHDYQMEGLMEGGDDEGFGDEMSAASIQQKTERFESQRGNRSVMAVPPSKPPKNVAYNDDDEPAPRQKKRAPRSQAPAKKSGKPKLIDRSTGEIGGAFGDLGGRGGQDDDLMNNMFANMQETEID